MKVSIVAKTVPAGILEGTQIDDIVDFVAYCARVSNPGNQMNTETSENLIKYLIRNKHWSPLEMADIVVEIQTTRDIGRQFLRHSSIKIQEFSQRYQDVNELSGGEDMFEWSECRLQDNKNRQNSLPTIDKELMQWWMNNQRDVARHAEKVYNEAIAKGIAKEVARKVLPEGLTKSRLYAKGSIRSWIHYLEARGEGTGTQKEHELLANEIALCISEIFDIKKFKSVNAKN
jgi:thymidylate synthase (FAD)